MHDIVIKEENYDKFIFCGSLALECYNDMNNMHEDLFVSFNNKLREYRSLKEKTIAAKENIVNELLSVIQKIGMNNFTIYDDGDVNCNYNNKGGEDCNVR